MEPKWPCCFPKAYFWIPLVFAANARAANTGVHSVIPTASKLLIPGKQQLKIDQVPSEVNANYTEASSRKKISSKNLTPTILDQETINDIIWFTKGHLEKLGQIDKMDLMKDLNASCLNAKKLKQDFSKPWSEKTQKSATFQKFNKFYSTDSFLNSNLTGFYTNKKLSPSVAFYVDPDNQQCRKNRLFSRTLSGRDLYSLAILAAYQYEVTRNRQTTINTLVSALKGSYAAKTESAADIHAVAKVQNNLWSFDPNFGSIRWRCMLTMNPALANVWDLAELVSKALQQMKPKKINSTQHPYCP